MLVVALIALRGPSHKTVEAGTELPGGSRVPSGVSAPAASGPAGPSTASTGPGRTSSAASSPATASTTAPTTALTPVAKVSLVVLNNTTITGLAQRASARFEGGGWTVTKYSNYQNDILSTCAYYDPGVSGAKAAAQALRRQFPAIKRVEPQFRELASWHSPIVVILTSDYTP